MGENSKISWTHHTWNPWWGCARVSPGCEHCYAETFAKRTGHKVWGRTAERRFLQAPFAKLAEMQHKAERAGERHRVFIASMADIFEAHPDPEIRLAQDGTRAGLWAAVPLLTHLDLLLLTKRPENIAEMVPAQWMAEGFPRNVWLGTTCEDQQRADERIPHLIRCPAAVRWVSYEPALGPIDFVGDRGMDYLGDPYEPGQCSLINWIVVGGESGGGARPFDIGWARSTVAQCRGADVPVFVKQMGARPYQSIPGAGYTPDSGTVVGLWGGGRPLKLRDAKGGDPEEWPEDLRVRQYPEVEHA